MSLRPINEIVRDLFAKIVIRHHVNEAMNATAPSDAVDEFMAANSIRGLAGLTWAQALTDTNDNRRKTGAK